MVIEENWAVDPERVRAFFAEQTSVATLENGFLLDGCAVTLTAAPGMLLGRWKTVRTMIRFEGEPEAVENVHRRFFLRFLSAGG